MGIRYKRAPSLLVVILPICVMNFAVCFENNHSMNTFAAASWRLFADKTVARGVACVGFVRDISTGAPLILS